MKIELLKKSQLGKILAIQEAVLEEVGEAQFSPVPRNQISCRLHQGLSFGAYVDDNLVGVLVNFLDEAALPIYATKMGIPINLDAGYAQFFYIVAPAYRGQRIANQLLNQAIHAARQQDVQHVVATVAVDNVASLKMLFENRMQIRYAGNVYGEKIRFITHQDLRTPQNVDNYSRQYIASADIAAQQKIISQQFVGVGIQTSESGVAIGYEKMAPPEQATHQR